MKRQKFLTEFLGALGAIEIQWKNTFKSSISGIVIYEHDDPEETQEFIWHTTESQVPDYKVLMLVEILHKQQLLDIDRINIPKNKLRKLYSKKIGKLVTELEFSQILEHLKSIEVNMIDEGKETDIFFIHE
ncbi:MAG: hypothetical protein HWE16_11970 [Gammaproteobacteria bacterium]|nr:hypothetical protein [Gammaproteobacteria bacterium]